MNNRYDISNEYVQRKLKNVIGMMIAGERKKSKWSEWISAIGLFLFVVSMFAAGAGLIVGVVKAVNEDEAKKCLLLRQEFPQAEEFIGLAGISCREFYQKPYYRAAYQKYRTDGTLPIPRQRESDPIPIFIPIRH